MSRRFVLTLSCPERPGIVHAVTSFVVEHGGNITEHQQFDDPLHNQLFLRTSFTASPAEFDVDRLAESLRPVADTFGMDWQLHDASRPLRLLMMVSRFDHCLTDLLYRWRSGTLGGEIVLVVSNHPDLEPTATAAGVPYVHVPVSAETKSDAETRLLALIDEYAVDLVVLARYMQVLSPGLCDALRGRAINIHHSFLPSFTGARPYHQAYERGVKQVGATAHYVTADLDEGPIIEQEVIRVDHRAQPEDLVRVGRDAERLALARAVSWHCEHRVLLHGNRTVVFD